MGIPKEEESARAGDAIVRPENSFDPLPNPNTAASVHANEKQIALLP